MALWGAVFLGLLVAASRVEAQSHIEADRADRAFRRGQALFETGDYVQALREFQNASILNGRHAESYYAQGLCLLRLGEPRQARRAFQRASDIEPQHAEALYNLGLTEAQLGDTAAARGHLQRALLANPRLRGAHFALARLVEKSGNRTAALEELQKELELSPDSAAVHYQLGYLLAEENRLEEARTHLEAATRGDHSLIGAWLDLGRIEQRSGDLPAAIEAYGRGLAADSTDRRLLGARGEARFARGAYAGAAEDFANLARLDTTNALAAFNWGVSLEKLEDWDGAISAYQTAIARDSSYADPHLNLAVLLGRNRREAEAITHLERYLALAPDAPNAEQVRQMLEKLRRPRRR